MMENSYRLSVVSKNRELSSLLQEDVAAKLSDYNWENPASEEGLEGLNL